MKLFIFLLSFCLLPNYSLADDWSVNGEKEHAPAEPENRIIKWCHVDGKKIRWASANLDIKDHKPCGKLTTVASCDAAGNKIIGKPMPGEKLGGYSYRDCSVGPRIHIETDFDEDLEYYEPTLTSLSPSNPESKGEVDEYMNQLDDLLDNSRAHSARRTKKQKNNTAASVLSHFGDNSDIGKMLEQFGGDGKQPNLNLDDALNQLKDILGGSREQQKQIDDLLN